MGTTLQHGIFLPAEGERNCYAGLASNWTILDGVVGGYSSHAANLTIHVTAADKEAWNGKADASALTAHTGDTTIHVTSADKQAWNGKADASALTAHTGDTTIHVTSADKQAWDGHVADSVKHVTAEDKNKWDAVTSKADDSDVVHKSGNETVGGIKTFDSNTYVYNSDNTATTPYLFLKNSKASKGSASETGSQLLKFVDKNNNNLCDLESIITSNGSCELRLRSNTLNSNNQNVQTGVTLISSANGGKNFCPTSNNNVFLGASTLKWARVYATNYYYGNDNVEFSTKFVTTDTAQTISGNKTFSSINGVEPSSLSLPSDINSRIDISSYFTNTGTGQSNSYTVPANGYIYLTLSGLTNIHCFSRTSGNVINYAQTFTKPNNSTGALYVLFPVRKNDVFAATWYTTTTVSVDGAFFIPCKGNI